MMPSRRQRSQRGVTLMITLIMLVVMTLFAVSSMRLANVNLKIAGNFQWQKQMEMMTDSALEQFISSANNFSSTAIQAGTATDQDICADGTVVASGNCSLLNAKVGTLSVPRCTGTRTASGYTKKLGELTPEDSDWVLKSQATDSVSGAKVTIYRGVTVRLLAGNCPE